MSGLAEYLTASGTAFAVSSAYILLWQYRENRRMEQRERAAAAVRELSGGRS